MLSVFLTQIKDNDLALSTSIVIAEDEDAAMELIRDYIGDYKHAVEIERIGIALEEAKPKVIIEV